MILVSIIIPIYKVEKYLSFCLDSVCAQTYSNLQIILINDGSLDHCEDICHEYLLQDPRMEYYRKENGGLGSARNYGMTFVKGEYVMFLDSDDFIHPQSVETLLNGIQNAPDASFIVGLYEKVVDKSCLNNISYCHYSDVEYKKHSMDDALLKYIINSDEILRYMSCWNRSYRVDRVSGYQFAHTSPAEDIYFNNRVYVEGSSYLEVDVVLYYYRVNPNSITRSIVSPSYFVPDLLRMRELYDLLPSSKKKIKGMVLERVMKKYFALRYACQKANNPLYKQYKDNGYWFLFLRSDNSLCIKILFAFFYYFPVSYFVFREYNEMRASRIS